MIGTRVVGDKKFVTGFAVEICQDGSEAETRFTGDLLTAIKRAELSRLPQLPDAIRGRLKCARTAMTGVGRAWGCQCCCIIDVVDFDDLRKMVSAQVATCNAGRPFSGLVFRWDERGGKRSVPVVDVDNIGPKVGNDKIGESILIEIGNRYT